MAKILIIDRGQDFSLECSKALKRKGHRVAHNNDVYEALREASVDGVDLILWDAPLDNSRARKYAAIKRYHRFIPLIIIDDDNEPYLDGFDETTLLMNGDSSVEQVVTEILKRVPEVVLSTLESKLNNLESVE